MSVRLANGLHMPELGFGTFQASGPPLHQAVLKALDVGIQHIDTATIYRVRYAYKPDDTDDSKCLLELWGFKCGWVHGACGHFAIPNILDSAPLSLSL